jgi:RNase P subunit RPR2
MKRQGITKDPTSDRIIIVPPASVTCEKCHQTLITFTKNASEIRWASLNCLKCKCGEVLKFKIHAL